MGRRMSRPEPNRQVRIADNLWNALGDLAHELGYDEDKRGAHSALIREMVASAVAKWRHSPYVCRSARYVAFVTRRGEVLYRSLQILKLNSDRQLLPCSLEVKPEKIRYYQTSCPEGIGLGEWIRDHWLLNYFAAWRGQAVGGRLLSHSVDRAGADSKKADLAVNLMAGRFVTRETVAVLRDYVQWDQGQSGYDRADFPIDIPTHELEIVVAVDADLYRNSSTPGEEISPLALEFRNRESARLPEKEVVFVPEMRAAELAGRAPRDEGATEVADSLDELANRVAEVAGSEVADGPVLDADSMQKVLTLLERPRDFLFYTLRWRSPHLGLEVCVRWEKPIKSLAEPGSSK